jgi:hypothetical protein
MFGLFGSYYVVTYVTQQKNSLDPALYRTEYISTDPVEYLEDLRRSEPKLNISLVYCDTISKKTYKKYS